MGTRRPGLQTDTMKHNYMHRRDTHKRALYNIKSDSGADEYSLSSSGRITKNKSKEFNKTLQGEAIFSSLYKRSGMLYFK